MAWRSSGSTNDELVDNLKQNGIISSLSVEQGFRAVDRRFFVPEGRENMAYVDQPLREENVHLSAPHIYGSAVEALELRPNTPASFLNVGSGTGYLTCVVASILGPCSSCHGVELKKDVVDHCQAAITKWKENHKEKLPPMQVVHGNGLNIDSTKGECTLGFDRIYIGASIDHTDLSKLTSLLKPGGILVGPVDDEMVKVFRLRKTPESSMEIDSDDFSQQVISGVRFSPLLSHPKMNTIIPSKIWEPSLHQFYPPSFREASKALLLCGNSQLIQPRREPEDRRNLAAMLPRVIWLEILSFTHRNWFESSETQESFLRQRLAEEQENAKRAHQARMEAEARCQLMERERDVFRLLARRWQSRLHLLMQEQRREGSSERVQQIEEEILLGGREEAVIFGLGTMLRGLRSDSDSDDDNDDDDDDNDSDGEMDAEEISQQDNEESISSAAYNIPFDEDSDDDANYNFSEDEADEAGSPTVQSSGKEIVVRPQVRTVSVSADDY